MRVTDLMVGDWVYIHEPECKGHRIDAIDELDGQVGADGEVYDECDIRPIPLTEEILMKNGFEKCHDDEAPAEECYFFRLLNKQCGWFDIDAFGLEEELGAEFTYHDINIHYVHQLQHLLRLCGIEKEIEL